MDLTLRRALVILLSCPGSSAGRGRRVPQGVRTGQDGAQVKPASDGILRSHIIMAFF